ncbi:MAG: Rv3235 family protein [Bifidobacteriaceae bacterium]|jgi:hypothetical protein|nr:Rv3235 family protein [Bifidobacteriaceae bacterium]
MDVNRSVWEGVRTGPVRLADVEARARFIASVALTAAHGFPPPSHFAPYVTKELFHRLSARARTRSVRGTRPCYTGRTYLCQINRVVIEATVIARENKQTHSVGMRLEHVKGLWVASQLVIV